MPDPPEASEFEGLPDPSNVEYRGRPLPRQIPPLVPEHVPTVVKIVLAPVTVPVALILIILIELEEIVKDVAEWGWKRLSGG